MKNNLVESKLKDMINVDICSIVEEIKRDKMLCKYILENTWLSGSNTIVYPIAICKESKQIIIQLNTDKRIFDKFIDRTCKKYSRLTKGYFNKSDGSCPSTIMFYYK